MKILRQNLQCTECCEGSNLKSFCVREQEIFIDQQNSEGNLPTMIVSL